MVGARESTYREDIRKVSFQNIVLIPIQQLLRHQWESKESVPCTIQNNKLVEYINPQQLKLYRRKQDELLL